jgi:hypothetical protein
MTVSTASSAECTTWDCPDPPALAAFYSTLLGLPVTYRDDGWVVVAAKLDGQGVYADPAGHPFCLIRRPRWAPPIPATP